MKKIITLSVCMALITVLCTWSLNAQQLIQRTQAEEAISAKSLDGNLSVSEAKSSVLKSLERSGTVVFYEGFEGTTGSALPAGWTASPAPGTTHSWTATNNGMVTHKSLRGVGCFYANSSARNAWAYTPGITLDAGVTYTIQFWLRQPGFGRTEFDKFQVKIGETASAAGMTTELYSNTDTRIYLWTPIICSFTPTTAGTYYLGFNCFTSAGEGDAVGFDDVSVTVANTNDLFVNVARPYPYTMVPKTQTVLPSLSAQAYNIGTAPQTNVQLTINHNGTTFEPSAPTTIAPTASANFSITTSTPDITVGDHTMTYTISQNETDNDLTDNVATSTFQGTGSVFAVDDNTTYWILGSQQSMTTHGNVYTFTQPTKLCQVKYYSYAGNTTNLTLGVYPVTGDLNDIENVTVGTTSVIPTQTVSKPNATAWQTVNITGTPTIPAGTYFVSFTETSNTAPMYILADNNYNNRMGFQRSGNNLIPNYRVMMLRLEVDLNDNDIAINASVPPFAKIPVSQTALPFPTTLTARAQNVGLTAQTNIVFSASFNGISLGESTPIANLNALATSANMNITPTAETTYPTVAGTYDFVYTVTQSETDENPADNTVTFPLEIGNTYALENLGTFTAGVGNTSPISAGNIFPIQAEAILKQVIVGFSSATTMNYSVSLYKMSNATTLVTPAVFTHTATRTEMGLQYLTVPQTVLEPGNYFLCVNQLGNDNMSLTYDTQTGSTRLKTINSGGTTIGDQANFGAGLIRMVFAPPCEQSVTDLAVEYTEETCNAIITWTAPEVDFNPGNCEGETITIGTGGASTNIAPFPGYYGFNISYNIYRAAEVGKIGEIESIDFDIRTATAASSGLGRVLRVYLMEIPAGSTIDESQSWNNLISGAALIFESTAFDITPSAWFKITLPTPFFYAGEGDLVVLMQGSGCATGGSCSITAAYTAVTAASGLSKSWYRDTTPYDFNAILSGLTGSTNLTYRSDVKFNMCTAPPNTFNVYRNDEFIANTGAPTYTDSGFDIYEGHTWSVAVVCPEGGVSEPVSITVEPCTERGDCDPAVLAVERVETGNQLTWTSDPAGLTARIYRDGVRIATEATSPYIDPLADYYAACYVVELICGNGFFAEMSNEACLEGCDFLTATVGTGTTTTNTIFAGSYGRNLGYHIYLAEEIAMAGDIESFSFNMGTVAAGVGRELKLYLMEVPAGTLIAENQSWNTLISGATLVYDSTNFEVTTGTWKKFIPINSFVYTGEGDLVVLFESKGCAPGGGCTTPVYASAVTAASGLAKTWLKDTNPFDFDVDLSVLLTTPPTGLSTTITTSRANIRFTLCPPAGFCYPPTNLEVSNITASMADVIWEDHATGSSYEYEYKLASETDWGTTHTTTGANISLTGLSDNTAYQVRVRSVCSSFDNESTWITASFTTACMLATAPWYYGFEDGVHSSTIIPCFTQAAVTGTGSWTINRTETGYNRTPRTGSANATLVYSNTRWLFKEIYLAPGVYSFGVWARQDGATAANAGITLSYGTTPTAAGMTTVLPRTGLVNGNYQEVSGKITITTAGNYFLGILGEINSSPWYISIDDIWVELMPNVDMQALTITGPTLVESYADYDYTVIVKNNAHAAANNYTVRVETESGQVLAQRVITDALASLATAEHTFSITFPNSLVGNFNIKGVVAITGDERPENNQTPLFGVELLPETDAVGTIGTGTGDLQAIPFNFYYKSSVAQSIYLESEIQAALGEGIETGMITQIRYHYNSTAAAATDATTSMIPAIKVYMVTTELSTLSGTWIPTNQFTLVYEGMAAIPIGRSELILNLDVPFNYTGGNLCIMTQRPWDTSDPGYLTGVNALVSTATPNARTRQSHQDAASPGVTPDNNTGTGSGVTLNTLNTIPNLTLLATVYYKLKDVISTGGGAVVTLDGDSVLRGEDATINIIVDDCYTLLDVLFDGVSQGPITQHTFYNLREALPAIEVVTELNHHDIMITYGPDGTVTPNGLLSALPCGDELTLYFTPRVGYAVSTIIKNGEPQEFTPNCTEWSTAITADATLHVTFAKAILYISTNVSGTCGNSDITPSSDGLPYGVPVHYNAHITFTFNPDEGCRVAEVLVDGEAVTPTAINTYTLYYVTRNHTIDVTFEKIPYPINASINGNGTISDAGITYVNHGTNKTYTFSAATGYRIANVFVNGVNNTAAVNSGTYTFTNVTAAQTITVVTAIKTYTIEATVDGAGGWITPEGEITVNHGDNKTFSFTPATGFEISRVSVNGAVNATALANGFHTFTNITANQTIEVTFAVRTYRMNAIAGANGSIYPTGSMDVEYGDEVTYFITPDEGYEVAYVLVNGNNIGAIASYTFAEIDADGEIEVSFSAITPTTETYTVNATASAGGTITSEGSTTVESGQNMTFTFTPNTGFKVDRVFVDGIVNMAAAADGFYTFTNITADHTIEVFFVLRIFVMNATAGANGSIYPTGTMNVNYGDDVTYSITPNNGYQISQVLVNGSDVNVDNTYTFTEIDADGTIEVSFSLILGIDNPTTAGISIYSQSNIVNIVNAKLLPIHDVSIFDMYGRVVWQGKATDRHNTITLDVANGIYTVRVATDEQFTTTKVSIQR